MIAVREDLRAAGHIPDADGSVRPGEGGKANSDNHEDRGQNVLYADGHVDWTQTALCGLNGDNIYANKNNAVWGSPVDAGDSVLLPAKR